MPTRAVLWILISNYFSHIISRNDYMTFSLWCDWSMGFNYQAGCRKQSAYSEESDSLSNVEVSFPSPRCTSVISTFRSWVNLFLQIFFRKIMPFKYTADCSLRSFSIKTKVGRDPLRKDSGGIRAGKFSRPIKKQTVFFFSEPSRNFDLKGWLKQVRH